MNEEISYRIFKILEEDPEISQRQLAQRMEMSLGKVNYCLKALMEKGLVKVSNFRNNSNKGAYAYLLTPKGLEEKAGITVRFLRRKVAEYETLEQEIQRLRDEVKALGAGESS